MMVRRPVTLSVIGWVFIIGGGLGLASLPVNIMTLRSNRYQPYFQLTPAYLIIAALRALVDLVAGIAILKGRDWGRWH